VWTSSFRDQFSRVQRFLRRIEDQDRDSTEYDDDLWSFFQNCHHLRDWIIYDSDVGDIIKKKVSEFAKINEELRICADLANRSKHLRLTRNVREDARVTNRSVTIDLGLGTSTCEHTITLKDGSKREALDVARMAVEAWKQFLSGEGLI